MLFATFLEIEYSIKCTTIYFTNNKGIITKEIIYKSTIVEVNLDLFIYKLDILNCQSKLKVQY